MQTITNLTPEQETALALPGKTCALIAGPGSGKTHLLTARILQDANRTTPAKMVVVTFTNAAARELRERITARGGNPAEFRHIGTLHSWASGCLRRTGDSRRIASEREIKDLIARTKAALGAMARNMSAAEIWRNAVAPPDFGNGRAIGRSVRSLMTALGLTHHDMVLQDFLGAIESDLVEAPRRIYVDEFQDSAPTDARIYTEMTRRGSSLYLIGDPRQAIYGFRGTSPEHLIRAWQTADTSAQLTTNHRSTPAICSLATTIARRMPEQPGYDPTVAPATDSDAGYVLSSTYDCPEAEMLGIYTWTETQPQGSNTSMAVLCRYNSQAAAIAACLRNMGKTVHCTADTEPEPGDALTTAIERVQAFGNFPAATINDPHDWWRSAMIALGIPMAQQDALLPRLLACATRDDLISLADTQAATGAASIAVTTIHGAKGLEWDAVWIAGADSRAIPDTAEGGRLAFVAATRARSKLIISHATGRVEPESGKRLTALSRTPWLADGF